jgi:hypothetical protein
MGPSLTEHGDDSVIEDTCLEAGLAQRTAAMFRTRSQSSAVCCRWGKQGRVDQGALAPVGVEAVVRGGGCKHATATFAHSVLAAVENPADGGPRSRRPISRGGFGLDVGFNRRLVQSDWKALHVSSGSQGTSGKKEKKR